MIKDYTKFYIPMMLEFDERSQAPQD